MPSRKMTSQDGLLFVGAHGHVRAVSKSNGRKVWETSLPGTSYTIVFLLYRLVFLVSFT